MKKELLKSVPAVGPVVASTLIADLPELGQFGHKQIQPLSGWPRSTVKAAIFGRDVGFGAEEEGCDQRFKWLWFQDFDSILLSRISTNASNTQECRRKWR